MLEPVASQISATNVSDIPRAELATNVWMSGVQGRPRMTNVASDESLALRTCSRDEGHQLSRDAHS